MTVTLCGLAMEVPVPDVETAAFAALMPWLLAADGEGSCVRRTTSLCLLVRSSCARLSKMSRLSLLVAMLFVVAHMAA